VRNKVKIYVLKDNTILTGFKTVVEPLATTIWTTVCHCVATIQPWKRFLKAPFPFLQALKNTIIYIMAEICDFIVGKWTRFEVHFTSMSLLSLSFNQSSKKASFINFKLTTWTYCAADASDNTNCCRAKGSHFSPIKQKKPYKSSQKESEKCFLWKIIFWPLKQKTIKKFTKLMEKLKN
jgi:hypothetical protein